VCGAYRSDLAPPHPLVSTLPDVVHIKAPQLRSEPALATVLSLLTAELERDEVGAEGIVMHLITVLFLYVLRAHSAAAQPIKKGAQHAWVTSLRDATVSSALSYMHREPERDWTVDALAERVGLSRAAFARKFTEAVGEPPLSYLTRWRMSLAARHLRESDISIATLAARVGYASEFAFSRAFKRACGVPPTFYRRADAKMRDASAPPRTSLRKPRRIGDLHRVVRRRKGSRVAKERFPASRRENPEGPTRQRRD